MSIEASPVAAIDRVELASRTLDGLVDYYRLLADTEDRSRAVENDGGVAAIVPATPYDAMFNSVVYQFAPDPCELERLDGLYSRHGVLAWGIWLADGDSALLEALVARRFTPIKKWTGMGMPIRDDPPPMLAANCEVIKVSVRDFAKVSDSARGIGNDYSRAFTRWSERSDASLWALRCAGRVVSTLLEIDCGEDCSVNSVATVRDQWGKGMAGALIQSVLSDARMRGYTTTTLQASPSAESLYHRLGYRPVCAWTVWASRCSHPQDHSDAGTSYSPKTSRRRAN